MMKKLFLLVLISAACISSCKKDDPATTPSPTPTPNSAQWQQTSYSYDTFGVAHTLFSKGSLLFAGTDYGVIVSSDTGNTWNLANSGATGGCYAIVANGNTLFAGNEDMLYTSSNNGSSWTSVSSGLPSGDAVNTLLYNGSYLFVGFYGGGIYRSSNNGLSWVVGNTGLTSLNINDLVAIGTNIFASTSTGIFKSTDNGFSWAAINSGLSGSYYNSIIAVGQNLYVQTNMGVYMSANYGTSWSSVNNGLPSFPAFGKLTADGTDIYYCPVADYNAYLSQNSGSAWTHAGDSPDFTVGGSISINSIAMHKSNLFMATNIDGVWRLGPL